MIPKIANYEDVIINNSNHILNDNFTSFEIKFLGQNYVYPYLECKINHSEREYIFSVLNKNKSKFFISRGEIIAWCKIGNQNYNVLLKDDEVIAYIAINDENTIIDYDCIPKYQRQGYVGVILSYLLKRKTIIHIEDSNIDNHILIHKLIESFLNSTIVEFKKEERLTIILIDGHKLLKYEDDMGMFSIARKYSNKGIFSYTESYHVWYP